MNTIAIGMPGALELLVILFIFVLIVVLLNKQISKK